VKVFLGSSREALEDLRLVASWLEEEKHEPLPWDEPLLFLPGHNTFARLIDISGTVDAAIFLFGEDDQVWYRQDAAVQPRDNVLIEYGLFAGRLGQKRAVVCRKGRSKNPTDLQGIVQVELDRPQRARLELLGWLRHIAKESEDPMRVELVMQHEVLKRELAQTREQLQFEQQKANDLQDLVRREGLMDFRLYDFAKDAHWKLLFDYEYFWKVVELLQGFFRNPTALYAGLHDSEVERVAARIQWDLNDTLRLHFYVAKVLRVFRQYDDTSYLVFLRNTSELLRADIESVGRARAEALRAQS
jgi:Predicted nucleotide-binding protein containing TIR-like domain